MGQTGLPCDLGKRPVVIVVVQVSGRGFVGRETFYCGTGGKKNISPPVVVIIKNNGAVAGGFNDEFFMSVAAVDVERAQSRLRCNIFEVD
jgi:hypothetical protein